MRPLTKITALFLSALLCIGLLAACGEKEKIPTVEEIYDTLDAADSCKFVTEQTVTASQNGVNVSVKSTTTQEAQGKLSHVNLSVVTSLMGTNSTTTSEMYIREEDGGKYTLFTKDDGTGNWAKTDVNDASELGLSDFSELKPLFSSDLYGEYDKETGKYTMKDGGKVNASISGMDAEFTDVEIGYKEGVYTISASLTAAGTTGSISMTLSDVGSTTVTLPEGAEG